jgi:hypothetical protein
MQQQIHSDMNLSCMLLLTCNGVMGWLSALDFVQWLQVFGIVSSIIASGFVSYNQYMTLKWKRANDRRERAEAKKKKKEAENE